MASKRTRLIGWTYDDETQEIRTPSGRVIALHDIATLLADQIEGRHDLGGKWSGWRIRQQWLIPPGGSIRQQRIAQHVLAHQVREFDWTRKEISRLQLQLF